MADDLTGDDIVMDVVLPALLNSGSFRPTVFHEDWWLDLAGEGRCQSVKIFENNRLLCWMPFLPVGLYGAKISRMPALTHCLGPVIDRGALEGNQAFRQRHRLVRELIGKLPHFCSFVQTFHRGIRDVLPFQACGFDTSVQHTFLVECETIEAAWQQMRPKTRNIVRTAEKLYPAGKHMAADAFLDLYRRNNVDLGRPPLKHEPVVRALMMEAMTRRRGVTYYASDASGQTMAAIFCLFDETSCYYAMSTRRPTGSGGAVSMLIWQAIKDAIRAGLVFDFDGVAFEGSVGLYSGFTERVESRFIVRKTGRVFEAYREARRLLGRPDNYFNFNT